MDAKSNRATGHTHGRERRSRAVTISSYLRDVIVSSLVLIKSVAKASEWVDNETGRLFYVMYSGRSNSITVHVGARSDRWLF